MEKRLSLTNDTTTKDIEFFLAEDIIQGEKIPFYLLWNESDPKEIILEFEGFKSIIELHNAIESKIITEGNKTVISGFHVPGYIGGLLSTEITDQPITYGSLIVTIYEKNGEVKSLKEVRKLYATQLKLADSPEEINLDDLSAKNKINIELNGKPTVFLDIEGIEKNECDIDIPPDVEAIFEKFYESLKRGLNDLKEKFPEHLKIIKLFLEIPSSKMSITQYTEKYGEEIKESFKDQNFLDAISTIFITAFFEQVGIEERLLKPLNEYFESSAVDRAYFLNPLLQVRVPSSGCMMAIKIKGEDLLTQECGSPLEIRVYLKAKEETFKPLKDLFSIRRVLDE